MQPSAIAEIRMRTESLHQLVAIYEAHGRGETIDIAAVEARLGRPLANEQRGYEVINGVAVLSIEGVMAPKANLITQISGGTSTQMVQLELQAAVKDPTVRAIILQIDSSGGSVLGTPELAAAVARASAVKRVVTFSDGMLASAAYWVGSGADAIYLSGSTTMVGSIGVGIAHRDVSKANEAAGVKVTEISAGKYKRIAGQNDALSADGRASLQGQVDYIYSLFVDAVAAHRGTSVGAVLERMADGRMFIGQQAIDAGLVDGFSTLDALIEAMATDPGQFAKRRKSALALGSAANAQGALLAGPLTRQQKADQASAYAAAHGMDFLKAFRKLGFDTSATAPAAVRSSGAVAASRAENHRQAAAATAHAAAHHCSFLEAFKALGFDRSAQR